MNLLVNYNKKHKCTEITEKIDASAKCLICVVCKCPMYPKKIIFKTMRNNGNLVFNYIGKGGYGCFF